MFWDGGLTGRDHCLEPEVNDVQAFVSAALGVRVLGQCVSACEFVLILVIIHATAYNSSNYTFVNDMSSAELADVYVSDHAESSTMAQKESACAA